MSKFRIGDRVKMSALGKERLRCDWIGRIIEIDASQYGDIVRMKIDGKGKSGLMSAEYLELDNMVGYAGSSSTISVSDLENV